MLPAETDILCENCGYTLNGLSENGRCPECGVEIGVSISPDLRKPPVWEDPLAGPVWKRFIANSAQVIFTPKRFFRSLNSRGDIAPALNFAKIHWAIAGILLGIACWFHSLWSWDYSLIHSRRPGWISPLILIGAPIGIYLGISITQYVAARLTAWEAAYREYRLPHRVVVRAMHYHAAHWLPMSLL